MCPTNFTAVLIAVFCVVEIAVYALPDRERHVCGQSPTFGEVGLSGGDPECPCIACEVRATALCVAGGAVAWGGGFLGEGGGEDEEEGCDDGDWEEHGLLYAIA